MTTETIIYGIICPENLQNKEFQSTYAPKIFEAMENPNIQFIFCDKNITIANYLNRRGFRNCIVYHVGNEPKHTIGNYRSKGGFSTYAEIECEILNEASVVIK